MPCNVCSSFAINHHLHGRDGSDPDLCDVCYWQKRAKLRLDEAIATERERCAKVCESILFADHLKIIGKAFAEAIRRGE